MNQVVRNLKDVEDGFLLDNEFLIMDHDKKYTKEFRANLKREGVRPIGVRCALPTAMRSQKDLCLQ